MSRYYLMSQLPSLDGIGDNAPLPITEERFSELCMRFLDKKAQRELSRLTLLPPRDCEQSDSALITSWNEGERCLRLALLKVRAERLSKPFDCESDSIPTELMQIARTAIEMRDPLEAESFLNRYRFELLEALRPADTFSKDAVFYYGLKLKLLLRIRQFDREKGKAAYKDIYYSILNGDRLEVE